MSIDQISGDQPPPHGAPRVQETPEEIEYELRAAEGALWTGGRLLIGVVAFAFADLAFAYFYLRSTNSDDLWRPGGITAPIVTGTCIVAIVVAGAVLNALGTNRLRNRLTVDWEVAGWTVVTLGLVAAGMQIWQMSELPFFPGSSGYASCFVAWGIMNVALLLSGTFWIETLLARSLRLRRAVAQEGGPAQSQLPVARMFRANVEGCTYFWWFIAGVSVFFWILFYVI